MWCYDVIWRHIYYPWYRICLNDSFFAENQVYAHGEAHFCLIFHLPCKFTSAHLAILTRFVVESEAPMSYLRTFSIYSKKIHLFPLSSAIVACLGTLVRFCLHFPHFENMTSYDVIWRHVHLMPFENRVLWVCDDVLWRHIYYLWYRIGLSDSFFCWKLGLRPW